MSKGESCIREMSILCTHPPLCFFGSSLSSFICWIPLRMLSSYSVRSSFLSTNDGPSHPREMPTSYEKMSASRTKLNDFKLLLVDHPCEPKQRVDHNMSTLKPSFVHCPEHTVYSPFHTNTPNVAFLTACLSSGTTGVHSPTPPPSLPRQICRRGKE